MDFETFLNKDITVHTESHTYRGILVEVLHEAGILVFSQGVDDFYIVAEKVIAITAHGREYKE